MGLACKVAKLCKEAIGPCSASLAWASNSRVQLVIGFSPYRNTTSQHGQPILFFGVVRQVVHAIGLLGVGAYAPGMHRSALLMMF